jgi:predicted ester cyclase
MSLEENKMIALRWHEEIFNKRNFAAFDEFLDPGYVNYTANIRGLEAAKEQFPAMMSDNPDMRLTTEDVVADGDKVALRWSWREVETVTYEGITILRFSCGKIVEDWSFGREKPEA